MGVGLLLPYVLRAVRRNISDRLDVLGECVGVRGADAFLEWLVGFLDQVGIPRTLKDIGVQYEDLAVFADKAQSVTRLIANHPGPTANYDLLGILEAAWSGAIA